MFRLTEIVDFFSVFCFVECIGGVAGKGNVAVGGDEEVMGDLCLDVV